ncbi:MAG: fatty acid desaturase [Leptolyngbya sp. SIO4C1]|nr:fatty acid desaturase [Leptolyngbya sp. SIO4C1]
MGYGILKYLLFWLLIERTVGIIIQTRDHLEHYGLWGYAGSYRLTQLYACRNVRANRFTNWLMGGLPYHSIHHAFPDIPFDQLPTAFERIEAVLAAYHLPAMTVASGYCSETLGWLWPTDAQPALIEAAGQSTSERLTRSQPPAANPTFGAIASS